jgi:hypothetical protein
MVVWKEINIMTLTDLMKAVDVLSPGERKQLRDYIDQSETEKHPKDVEFEMLLEALEAIREGMTDEEFAEIEHDMNVEYIEPLDDAS